MNSQTMANLIISKMDQTPKGTIYTNSDFYDLGNVDTVRKSLSRLCGEGKIYRLIEGYYAIPYFIELVKEYSYPTTDELAKKIAEKYAWRISPYGGNALNLIGLSTQVPEICEYISDGPYREFTYLNRVIKFKHTSNRSISNYSKSISLLIQSIKAIGKENVTANDIEIMANYCTKHIQEDIVNETKAVPVWVYEVIKKIER